MDIVVELEVEEEDRVGGAWRGELGAVETLLSFLDSGAALLEVGDIVRFLFFPFFLGGEGAGEGPFIKSAIVRE